MEGRSQIRIREAPEERGKTDVALKDPAQTKQATARADPDAGMQAAAGRDEGSIASSRKKKDRYLFTRPGERFLFLAGVWNAFHEPLSGRIPERFTILTTGANPSMARYHDRMPVILTEAEVDDWLAGPDFARYLDRDQAEVRAEKLPG